MIQNSFTIDKLVQIYINFKALKFISAICHLALSVGHSCVTTIMYCLRIITCIQVREICFCSHLFARGDHNIFN